MNGDGEQLRRRQRADDGAPLRGAAGGRARQRRRARRRLRPLPRASWTASRRPAPSRASGLDEAPPARARAAIMQAAAAHLAAQPQAQPAAARRPAAPEKVSFWDRLRARWAFPTLATVGAVAVFVVANRVFLNPERTLAPRPAAEAPSVPAAPALSGPARAATAVDGRTAGTGSASGPATRRERARGPRDDESRAHHGKWADGDLRGAGKKMKKGEDAERELAERPGAKGGARAEEKPKRDRDEPRGEQVRAAASAARRHTGGVIREGMGRQGGGAARGGRGARRAGRPVVSAREKAGAREGWVTRASSGQPRRSPRGRIAARARRWWNRQRQRCAGRSRGTAEQVRELRIGRRGRAARARDASTDDQRDAPAGVRCGRQPARAPGAVRASAARAADEVAREEEQ